MSAPNSVEELLQLIRKSGMVDEQKLNMYLQRREAGRGLPEDPREAADAMLRDGLITGFQAEQFLLGKWRGFTIGKYKLLERVGVGGMGQVFLCEHTFMKRRVAVKILPPAKAEQPAALGRFYREARAAGSIEHENIVRTHDIDQDGNLHFIVMEYVDGSNLLDIVKKFGPLELRRACSYIRQVALGLDYAFRNGIIHRDIKPGNVLIDRNGRAKLLDMGLARFYNDHTDNLTIKYDDKIVLGTADYVAPEQVANSHNVDVRADIYALGASFYFLLAGHPPFPNGTVSQKLLWHRTKDPTPIRQIRPEVPEEVANIVSRMMQKDPKNRFQTPAEVVDALERWVPANVPLPALEEMPQLSPAALEAAEEMAQLELAGPAPKSVSARQVAAAAASVGVSASIGNPPRSELRTKSISRPSPFAPPTAPTAPTTETPDPAPKSVPVSRLGSPSPSESVSRTKAKMPSPFPAPPEQLPPPPSEPAPRPAKAPEAFKHPAQKDEPGTFPVIAMPQPTEQPNGKKPLFYALIGLSILLAVGLIGWKLGASSQKVPPQQVIAPQDEQK